MVTSNVCLSPFLFVCFEGQLKANNAQLMDEAIQALQNLARQCSDTNAVQDIVTHLFKILGGEVDISNLNDFLCGFIFDILIIR